MCHIFNCSFLYMIVYATLMSLVYLQSVSQVIHVHNNGFDYWSWQMDNAIHYLLHTNHHPLNKVAYIYIYYYMYIKLVVYQVYML